MSAIINPEGESHYVQPGHWISISIQYSYYETMTGCVYCLKVKLIHWQKMKVHGQVLFIPALT